MANYYKENIEKSGYDYLEQNSPRKIISSLENKYFKPEENTNQSLAHIEDVLARVQETKIARLQTEIARLAKEAQSHRVRAALFRLR